MRGEASAALRLEKIIAEDVLFCERPIRLNVGRVDVLIDVIVVLAFDRRDVEAVHLTVRGWVAPGAVALLGPGDVVVARRQGLLKWHFLQRYFITVVIVTVRLRVGAWKRLEQLIRRTVLLYDDDDMLDRARRRNRWHGRRHRSASA